jgi:hypothetical protein
LFVTLDRRAQLVIDTIAHDQNFDVINALPLHTLDGEWQGGSVLVCGDQNAGAIHAILRSKSSDPKRRRSLANSSSVSEGLGSGRNRENAGDFKELRSRKAGFDPLARPVFALRG